ncbi:MAG: preprotein translocase subunit YajC [Verrucomicrobiales bacterium]
MTTESFLAQTLTLAQAEPGPGGGGFELFMPLIFMFVIFYFLLIRPQQKQRKEHEKLIQSVRSGDKVVTNAGIHGIVTNVKERTVHLKIADNVKIELEKFAIASLTRDEDEEEKEAKTA